MDLETLRTFIQIELDKATKEANGYTDEVRRLREQVEMPCNKGNEWVILPRVHKTELKEHLALGITVGLINVLTELDKEN